MTNIFCATVVTNEDDPPVLVDTNCVPSSGELAFSPDGRLLAVARVDGKTALLNVTNDWKLERTLEGTGSAFSFSPDGRLLGMIASGRIEFWRVSDGQRAVQYDGLTEEVTALAISPDGRHFAFGVYSLIKQVVLSRMPLLITDCRQAEGQAVFCWNGGSGLYQVQRTTNLVAGLWENVGSPTADSSATNTVTGTVFYRVQSLPNP